MSNGLEGLLWQDCSPFFYRQSLYLWAHKNNRFPYIYNF